MIPWVYKMTGHFVRARVKTDFSSLFKSLVSKFANIYANVMYEEKRVGIILGEKYFFRTNSTAAICIFVKELNLEECLLDIISFAGGGGLLDISWGAHYDYVHEVLRFIGDLRVDLKKELEINYFSFENLPQDIAERLKNL